MGSSTKAKPPYFTKVRRSSPVNGPTIGLFVVSLNVIDWIAFHGASALNATVAALALGTVASTRM